MRTRESGAPPAADEGKPTLRSSPQGGMLLINAFPKALPALPSLERLPFRSEIRKIPKNSFYRFLEGNGIIIRAPSIPASIIPRPAGLMPGTWAAARGAQAHAPDDANGGVGASRMEESACARCERSPCLRARPGSGNKYTPPPAGAGSGRELCEPKAATGCQEVSARVAEVSMR